jgi:hypothetical protein
LGIEEFVADGIIVLKKGSLDHRPFRELEILKMRGSPTPEVQAVFTLKGRFRVFQPFKPKPVERPSRFKPCPDAEDRFSTGSRDLDEMLGAALIEVDGRTTTLQHHLVCMTTARNFMAQGRTAEPLGWARASSRTTRGTSTSSGTSRRAPSNQCSTLPKQTRS